MQDRSSPFEKHKDKEFFYKIAMTQCGVSGDTPFYLEPGNSLSHPIRFKTLARRDYLAFVEFLGSHYDPHEMVLKTNGTRFLNLWVADDRWEMFAKLSERFPNQIRGILAKIRKSDLIS